MSQDTREQIEHAIDELLATGEKINASRVASKAGISHSLIYNRYPDLKIRIEQLKSEQKAALIKQSADTKASDLEDQVERLKIKVHKLEFDQVSYKKQNHDLWEYIQQVYFMYDQVLAERNEFARRLRESQ